MDAPRAPFRIGHPTVVPTNLRSDDVEEARDADAATDAADEDPETAEA